VELQNQRINSKDFLSLTDEELLAQCEESHLRSSGPGGQKRNKTSSAVRLTHRPTGLIAAASDNRSQRVNKVHALRRLRETIALERRTPIAAADHVPSDLLKECISPAGRFTANHRDLRYYVAVSEVLDILVACGLKVSEAAEIMQLSTGQLVKLLRKDPALWARVGKWRKQFGLSALRA